MDICGFEWTSIEFSGCWWIFMNRVDMCHGPVTWFLETHQQKMPSPPWKYPWNKESCSRQWDDHTPSTTLYVTPMKPLNPWRPWFDLGSNPTPNIEHHLNCPNGMWNSRTEPWFLRACFILGGKGSMESMHFWDHFWDLIDLGGGWFDSRSGALTSGGLGIAHNQIVFEYWRICLEFTFAWHLSDNTYNNKW